MGWSACVRACWVRDAWTNACLKSTGIQNVFDTPKGRYMFETGREQPDGAIVGQVWKYVAGGFPQMHVKRAGSFRIEGDGTVTRAPKFLKDNSPTTEQLDQQYHDTYVKPQTMTIEEVQAQNDAAIAAYEASR